MLPEYPLPSLDLLSSPGSSACVDDEQLCKNLELIVETLRHFKVEASPGEITPTATVTRYEVYPAPRVRVERISRLGRDLARVLRVERVDVLAPLPGKSSVGIDVPNPNKSPIVLRELLESKNWRTTNAMIPVALGKDFYGKALVADLTAMPHLLLGGTTGSGKSVCLNCVLLSLLFKFSPDELRLILIDPMRVEMQVYNGLPHLIAPVVTDPKKVAFAFRWIGSEIERRYSLFAENGVLDIASFNSRNRRSEDREWIEGEPVTPDKLPYIVIIVDEFTDLMQLAPQEVEVKVARLATKARAAGVHLVISTQTPRREIVTSLIKNNIPARIAFQVPSSLDSRVILDDNGAETLFGKGDFLYRSARGDSLVRGQGAYVSDEEVHAVVRFVRSQVSGASAAVQNVSKDANEIGKEDQELIIECWKVIRSEKRASTSNLQRRLRLGYNRAAYVIDYLEKAGVLGPGDGAKPREILVSLDSEELFFANVENHPPF